MEIGRHLVLSTVHVSMKTADMLDGWFIPTREAEEPDREQIPDEVLAAMRLGREQGCDYLLFDCDASAIDALQTFPW